MLSFPSLLTVLFLLFHNEVVDQLRLFIGSRGFFDCFRSPPSCSAGNSVGQEADVLCARTVDGRGLLLVHPQNALRPTPNPCWSSVITNEPNGNFIVAADIGSDGKLVSCCLSLGRNYLSIANFTQNLREAVDTGGLGSHGISASITDPDPFFSQGAVKASAAGNIVAAVNVS